VGQIFISHLLRDSTRIRIYRCQWAVSYQNVTLPNYISILRILLVPIFVASVVYYVDRGLETYRYLAITIFGIAALSDAVDGYLARRLNQASRLGAILDPLADKLLLVSGIVVLSLDHRPILPSIPIWLTTLIISRDVILPLGTILISYTGTTPKVQPKLLGKLATVAQMLVILWALFKAPQMGLQMLIILSGLLTFSSGMQYIYDGVAQLNALDANPPKVGRDSVEPSESNDERIPK
jgi:cardiolipin synthase (CMP-forming)